MADCIISSPFFVLLLLMKVFPICWVVKSQEAAVFWSAFANSFRWYSLSLNLFLSRFKSPMNIIGLSDCDAFSTCWSIFFSLSLWEEMVSLPSWLFHSLYTPAIMILLPCLVSTSIHIIGTPASIMSVLTRTFSFICGLISESWPTILFGCKCFTWPPDHQLRVLFDGHLKLTFWT